MTKTNHRPIPLLFITGSWSFAGGAEPLLDELVRRLDPARCSPFVCTLFGDGNGGYANLARQRGIRVVHLPMRLSRPWRVVWSLVRLVRLLRQERVAVVHGWQDRGIGVLAGALARTPVRVQTIHALDPEEGLVQRLVDWLTINFAATRTLTVSRMLARGLRRRCHQRVRLSVIVNGSSLQRLVEGPAIDRQTLGIPAGAPVVLFAGRLSREKGADIALEAFALLRRAIPEARLVLIGEGPLRAALEARAVALNVTQQVTFAGYQRYPGPWFRLAAAVVMPSRWEALGMTAIEAAALGVPVVASNIGGLPEVVRDGETGLLPEPHIWQPWLAMLNPAPFAAALSSLLTDPERARAMGEAGRRWYAAHFTVERWVERHQTMYERLLTRRIPACRSRRHGIRAKIRRLSVSEVRVQERARET